MIEVTALRDIAPGQQLLMSYGRSAAALDAPQRFLWRDYGFRCLCVRCRGQACEAVLRGVTTSEVGAPFEWLKSYAAKYEMSAKQVAHDVLQCLPTGALNDDEVSVSVRSSSSFSDSGEDDGSSASDRNSSDGSEGVD